MKTEKTWRSKITPKYPPTTRKTACTWPDGIAQSIRKLMNSGLAWANAKKPIAPSKSPSIQNRYGCNQGQRLASRFTSFIQGLRSTKIRLDKPDGKGMRWSKNKAGGLIGPPAYAGALLRLTARNSASCNYAWDFPGVRSKYICTNSQEWFS